MQSESGFWCRTAYHLAIIAAIAFLVLTTLAMFTYPGGTWVDSKSVGYSFLQNFFSDLGITVTYAGKPNTISMGLFTFAVASAGVGLIVFFLALAHRFAKSSQRQLSRIGSGLGMVTGICFFGIAFTPQDLFSNLHDFFSMLAFLFFPLAALTYATIIARTRDYPKRFAYLFAAFALLLVGYFVLFMFGPPLTTAAGLFIQATGQKLIVYASIFLLLLQAYGVVRLVNESQ